jgi:hypothetical protein
VPGKPQVCIISFCPFWTANSCFVAGDGWILNSLGVSGPVCLFLRPACSLFIYMCMTQFSSDSVLTPANQYF